MSPAPPGSGPLPFPDPSSGPPRIAIVGVGPKGLYCLERLAAEMERQAPSRLPEIHLFDPHPFPGAGPVYDPGQPPYLRMNFANSHVDLWSREGPELPFPRPTFVEWLEENHPAEADPHAFAPRALAGEYLHAGLHRVVAHLQSRCRVHRHAQAVHEVRRRGARWEVRAEALNLAADEVLIATGHDSRGRAFAASPHPKVLPGVFPVEEHLGPESIPPESVVAVRGFALTALDATIALFEGRGGGFRRGEAPSWVDYEPSGLEAGLVVPFSRSGRPMVPKPDPRFLDPLEELGPSWDEGRRQLEALAEERPPALPDEIVEILVAAADRALRLAGGKEGVSGTVTTVRRRVAFLCCHQEGLFGGETTRAALERSLEVALGERPRDDEWALGEAWRKLYPGLVSLVGERVFSSQDWAAFGVLAREMERLAFGPPADLAARYLALVRAGKVDLRFVEAPEVKLDEGGVLLRHGDASLRADLLVDAVLAPPGAAPAGSPLLSRLEAQGYLRIVPGTAGVDVTAAGRCLDASGRITPGLAVVGRPTEGSVLGNDTLSRTLHEQPARWAASVAESLFRKQRALA